MSLDIPTLIESLKFEIEMLERGGYFPSVRDPRNLPRIFRDSVTCPNVGLEIKVEPCEHCNLAAFVPQNKLTEEKACHHIPLNERGDTVESLEKEGDPEKLHAAVLAWLKS
ncbi:MAG: hypothetical protein HY046_08160, partial [Acidobacteria bacterium]|nr:hypothetical protein [Acidobacteriota bacterium]